MSSIDDITRSCGECRRLIELQLQAREELAREIASNPRGSRVAVLEDKVHKLQRATGQQFMKAMDALTRAER